MDKDVIAVIIIGVTIISFMMEKIPLGVTAMCSALAMAMFGILRPAQVFAGFAGPITPLIVGMMIIGNGLFETGAARIFGLKIAQSRLARTERGFVALIALVAGVVSGFFSNTATVAMFMPIIAAVAYRSAGIIQAKYATMAMSMAVIIGSCISVVGNPTQLILQNVLIQTEGGRRLGFLEVAPLSLTLLVVFCVYAYTWGYNISKKHFDFEEVKAPVPENELQEDKIDINWRVIMSSLVTLAVIFVFVLNLWDQNLVAITGAAVLLGTRCIDYKRALREVDWNTIVIISGAQAFAFGFDSSGGGRLVANFILGLAGGESASSFVLLVVAVFIAASLTNFMSNTALTAMMIPLFMPLALAVDASPITFGIAIAMASNMSIATPVGTVCVAMTLPVGYRYKDYVRYGLPMNILLAILVIPLVLLFFGMNYK